MSTRLSSIGSFLALQKWRAAHANSLPAGWVGDGKKTNNQTDISAEEDIVGLSETPTFTAGRRYLVMAKVRTNPDNDPMEIIARLYIDGVQVDSDSWRTVVVTEDHRMNLWAVHDCDETGSVVVKVAAASLTPGTTFDCIHSSITPGRLLIVDIGPVPE